MSKRNLVWLAAIIVVGIVGAIALNWVWGVVLAVATLVVSELVERSLRRKRQLARGAEPTSPLRGAIGERKRRR